MRFVTLLTVLFTSAAPGFGQTFGEITGEVRDSSGAAVQGATVIVTSQATGASRSVTTNEAGVYSFPALQPGSYGLKVEMPGFRTIARGDLGLQVQQTARADFTLEIGQVTEVVEVSGGAALLTTENATVGTVIENRRIVDLPLNGRNFLQLVALSPNVSFGFGSGGSTGAQGGLRSSTMISVSGQRAAFNHFTLDGLENTNVEANTYVFLPSIDALQEFKVQSGIYPAEFGRASSQINVSTKAGGNDYHGTLYEFLRNEKLDATNYAFTTFRPERDPFRWNQYGFTLGGPVWIPKVFDGRNRLFFMSNFEGFRDRKQLRRVANVPSSAMREGNFGGIQQQLFDPVSHARQGNTIVAQPFPGNLVPRNRIHAASIRLLDYYPEPNRPEFGLVSNFQAGQSRAVDRDQFNQRVDFIESSASNWFGRYSWANEVQLLPGLKLNGTQILNKPWQAMISNTRVLSPSFVNESRFGVSRFTNANTNELAFQQDVMRELNIPGIVLQPAEAWGTPLISIAGFSGFGAPTGGPNVTYASTFQWVDNVSWIRGKHSFRFGLEVRRDRWSGSQYTFSRGEFVFEGPATQNPASPSGTGYGFADYLLGYCRLCRAGVAQALAQFRGTSQYYYIDDSWKVRPNLTISFGLRYENTPPWYDRSGRFVNVHIPAFDRTPNVQDLSRHPTLVRVGSGDFYENVGLRFNPAIQVARDGRLGPRGVMTDNNDFAPRLGIAWSPTPKWTVRTGGGIFYSQDAGTPKLDPSRNLAGYRFDEMNPDFPDLNWNQPFRDLTAGVQVNTPAVLGNQHQRRTPYAIQYLLNVQRELMTDTVIEIGYLGSVSRKLEQYRSFNYAEPAPTGSIASRVPYPEFGRVFLVDPVGLGNYNSFAAKFQRRFSGGLTYLASYTWSKSIDTLSAIRQHAGDALFAQDEFCIQCDRALSSYDARQRLVTSALYELPFGKGKRFASGSRVVNAMLGGWQVGSIVTLQSGFPLNVFAGRDQCNCGHQSDRVDATGQATDLQRGSQDPERFFNTSAYALQPFGSFGSTGRNTVMGPGIISWDFSTVKNFVFAESKRLEFRFEAFNFPNHPNWGPPNTTFLSPDFGKVRSTRTSMRELQFGLKLNF
ncbi:MAG: carboxypeptidase-like regulatory domain-containing protein [Bryobacteraceae bacterium]